jgi:hypothetical protein
MPTGVCGNGWPDPFPALGADAFARLDQRDLGHQENGGRVPEYRRCNRATVYKRARDRNGEFLPGSADPAWTGPQSVTGVRWSRDWNRLGAHVGVLGLD